MTRDGLPHLEIVGSEAASALPTLIVGNHVLHRLLVPRHPPYALSNLTKNLCWYIDRSSQKRWRCINRISDRKLYLGFAFGINVHSFVTIDYIVTTSRYLFILTSQLSKNKKTIFDLQSTIVDCFVELVGIEPATSWLQTRRSPSWATAPSNFRFST
jgi:hypothetical protein